MKKVKKNGFSILELMVVVALIGIIGTLFVTNFRGANKKKALDLAAEKLLGDLKEIQANALNAKEFSGTVYCGWGIHYIDEDTYIYYVGGKPGILECSNGAVNRDYQLGQDTIARSVDLQNKGDVEFSGSFLDIFFESPNPDTYIGNVKDNITTMIILQLKADASAQRIITITSSGKIQLN